MEEIMLKIYFARFTTTDELFERKKFIREEVQQFDYDTLEIYKWYFFFQLCMLKNPLKLMLWDYLVKEEIKEKDEINLNTEYRTYKNKCKRIIENQKKKDKEKNEDYQNVHKKHTIKINSVEDLFKI